MLGWLRRLLAPEPARPAAREPGAKRNGYFSTDLGWEEVEPEAWGPYFGQLDQQVFQRGALKKAHQGVAVAGAMDEADGFFSQPTLKGAYSTANYGIPTLLASWYAAQGFIGYQMCAVLLQHWFIDKACTMPARDAMRNGYDITVNADVVDPAVLEALKEYDKTMHVSDEAVEMVRMCRAYGVRVVIFQVDGIDYEKPFNIDGVQPGAYKGMSQVDPYWITPELDFDAAANPASRRFYNPTYWRVSGQRYHWTHLVVIRTCNPPDVLKPTYFYGGIPLPQRIYERVYAAERTANEGPQLAMTKRTTVLNIDIAAATANQGGLNRSLQKWAALRDNYGTKVLGLAEQAQQFDTTLNDLDAVIMTQYQLCCAIAEVPATKMLGTMPKGFNATGEYEESSYHESLKSIQSHDCLPLIERHHLLVKKSYVCPKFGIPMFKTTIVFNPLDEETGKERADRRLAESNADKNWSEAGAIDGDDIRARLIADPESGYNGIAPGAPEDPRLGMGANGGPELEEDVPDAE